MWFGLGIGIVFAAAAAPVPSGPAVGTPVPIARLPAGLVAVAVDAPDGGPPLTFVLDTGAGITVVSSAAAAALGVTTSRAIAGEAAGGRLELLAGRCPSLTVGGVVFDDLRVAVLDLPPAIEVLLGTPIDGILGRTFLDRADVALDLAHDTLTVLPPGTFGRRDRSPGFVRQRFRLVGGAIRIPVRVGAADVVSAALDLGGDHSLVNWSMAEASGATGFVPIGGSLVGADGSPVPLIGALTVSEVALGPLALTDVSFGVCEDAPCDVLLDRTGPRVHLGIDVFGDRELRLSYAARTLYVSD
ncbi:MAG: retropepsin-like aspartic protease [Myxococcota bacterium]